ncbi:hypothetical protein JTE90_014740 [Oedothorax gibbosus]|uniref:Uncharacterized protein n=1 Tax=Oedothorax gibbosus TaxID=931172 RepID=A0AAV6URD3_9ARAC|nr:hypothetical protein JTE90_014740 [Oedothorax gibbosus]
MLICHTENSITALILISSPSQLTSASPNLVILDRPHSKPSLSSTTEDRGGKRRGSGSSARARARTSSSY